MARQPNYSSAYADHITRELYGYDVPTLEEEIRFLQKELNARDAMIFRRDREIAELKRSELMSPPLPIPGLNR